MWIIEGIIYEAYLLKPSFLRQLNSIGFKKWSGKESYLKCWEIILF